MNVAIINRYAEPHDRKTGGRRLELSDALQQTWRYDAHFVQYDADCRLSKASIVEHPMLMVCAAFDYDCPNHEPSADHFDKIADLLTRLPVGCVAYFTANGFRVVTMLPDVFTVATQAQWEQWRAYHAGLRLRLDTILNGTSNLGGSACWLADPTCDDPSRLFRLPNVKRKDAPSYPELIGELGTLSWEPIRVVPREAVECSDGEAAYTTLGKLAIAHGVLVTDTGSKLIVECPWHFQHSSHSPSGTVIFHTEDGLGHFHCSHNSCSDKHTHEALEAWGYDFGEPFPLPKGDPGQSGGSVGAATVLPAGVTAPDGFLDAADLAKPRPPVEWLCRDLELGFGRPPLITSDPGAGKTWATQALALSVASGQKLFGAFEVMQAPVLHVSIDSGINATVDRYQKLARGMGLKLEDLPLRVCTAVPPMIDKYGDFRPEAFKKISEDIGRRGVKLVILDSLSTICAGLDENSTEIAGPLAHTKDDLTCCVWTHHNNRQGQIRGSSALRAAAGVWWSMSIDEESKDRVWKREKASEDHREPDEGEQEILAFRTTWTKTQDGGCIVTLQKGARKRDEDPRPATLRLLREALENYPTGLTQTQLLDACAAVPLRRDERLQCLAYLEQQGAVTKEKCKRAWLYFPGGRS